MAKLTASFLGRDCPGVVASITCLLGESGCNIEAMSQTMLSGEFAAIFIVSVPEGISDEKLRSSLQDGLKKSGVDLSVMVRPAIGTQWGQDLVCEPFVVTVDGPDGPGLIGSMSKVFARHGVNIVNLTAILDASTSGNALFVFEVLVPVTVDVGRLRRELALEGKNLGLRVSAQHRNIFEAVHRVKAF